MKEKSYFVHEELESCAYVKDSLFDFVSNSTMECPEYRYRMLSTNVCQGAKGWA